MKIIFYVISVGSLLLASCSHDFDSLLGPKPINVPENFDWKTTRSNSINISVESVEGVSDNAIRTIKVYASSKLDKGELLAVGGATPQRAFVAELNTPAALNYVFVQEKLPNGVTTLSKVALQSRTQTLNIAHAKRAVAMSTRAASSMVDVPTVDFPQSYDVTFTGKEKKPQIKEDKTYFIPVNVTVADVDMGNGTGFATLYVAGTLNIKNNMQISKSALVVLPGGKVNIGGQLNAENSSYDKVTVYVAKGGEMVMNKANISSGRPVVNYGTLSVVSLLDINNNTTLYNLGDINDNKQGRLQVILSNSAVAHNDGSITSNSFEINSLVKFYNYENGKISIEDEFAETNTNCLFVHKGEMIVGDFSSNGQVDVYCSIYADEITFYGSIFNLYAGSYVSADEMTFNSTRINMYGGSMLEAYDFEDNWAATFTNPDKNSGYAVMLVRNSLDMWAYGAASASGYIEVVAMNEKSGDYTSRLSNGAVLTTKQEHSIAKNSCNGGRGSLEPEQPEIVDVDGDGVPADEDVDDNDPTVAYRQYYPSQNTWGTYCFEDAWPNYGDYDMNDIVLGFQVVWTTNAQNKVVYADVNWELRAYGALFEDAVALQLDNITPSQIESIVSSYAIKETTPFNVVAGMEPNQSKAVIPLFNKASAILPHYANTNGDRVATKRENVRIKFAEPVDISAINIESLNMFMVAGSSRENEIHLVGYQPTDLAKRLNGTVGSIKSAADMYRGQNNYMWALMFPCEFLYPIENFYNAGSQIYMAYPEFNTWASSGGTQNKDWYKGPRKEELVY